MWAVKAVVLTLKVGVCVLAVAGGASVYAVTMLMSGHWGPEQILTGVMYLEQAQAWVAGVSGTGIAAAFARYGFPVLGQILSDRRAASEASLAEKVAAILRSPR